MRTATANQFELELGDFLPVAVAGLNALTRQPMRGERAERKNYNNPSTIRSIGLSRSKGFEPKEGIQLIGHSKQSTKRGILSRTFFTSFRRDFLNRKDPKNSGKSAA